MCGKHWDYGNTHVDNMILVLLLSASKSGCVVSQALRCSQGMAGLQDQLQALQKEKDEAQIALKQGMEDMERSQHEAQVLVEQLQQMESEKKAAAHKHQSALKVHATTLRPQGSDFSGRILARMHCRDDAPRRVLVVLP